MKTCPGVCEHFWYRLLLIKRRKIALDTSVQYRVVGELAPSDECEAVLTEPGLEDSYVWLMRERNAYDTTIAAKDDSNVSVNASDQGLPAT